MNYVGDFTAGSVVYIYFNTFDSNDPSASVTMTNFVDTDVHIHKNDSLTQRNDTAGVAIDVDVDAIAGTHFISIDTADNTVADFFAAGNDYFVRIEGVTIDAAQVNAVVGSFSIENRHVAGIMAKTTIATLASQTSFTLTAGSADNDAYNNCIMIVTDQITAIQKAVGRVSDYVGSTLTITLAADPGIFTMAVGDNVSIIATSALANVDAVGGTVQTAGDIVGDWIDGGRLDLLLDAIPTTAMRGTDSAGTAANLATVDTVVDAIKVATDKLTFTVANQVDANVIGISSDNTAADNLELFVEGTALGTLPKVNTEQINAAEVVGDGNATPWDGA